MKTVNFIARATQEQAARWQAVARYQGHRTVGAWLGTLATEKLREVGKLLPHEPLVWHRGIFSATLTEMNRHPMEAVSLRVTGWLEGRGVFGIYRGGSVVSSLDRPGSFSLVHVPTGRQLCTLDRLREAKSVAQQLAALKRMAWEETDPEKVVGDDAAYARGIIERAGGPPRGWEPEPPCPEP